MAENFSKLFWKTTFCSSPNSKPNMYCSNRSSTTPLAMIVQSTHELLPRCNRKLIQYHLSDGALCSKNQQLEVANYCWHELDPRWWSGLRWDSGNPRWYCPNTYKTAKVSCYMYIIIDRSIKPWL